MGWCSHCKDSGGFFSTNYVCNLTDKYIPSGFVNDYCKYDYRVSSCPWYKEYGQSSSSSFCFITTVTCNILGKDDKDPVLQDLRSLRDNYLQKDSKYDFILKAYDTIAPQAAKKMMEDEEKVSVATELYEDVLTPIAKLVEIKQYELASELYYCMTLKVYKKYDLLKDYNELMDNDFGYKEGEFDQSTAGHGMKLINLEEKAKYSNL